MSLPPHRLSSQQIDAYHQQGFVVVENFLAPDELAQAQADLWLNYPRPDEYFANPEQFARLQANQFAGLRLFPFKGLSLSQLVVHERLLDFAAQLLESDDIRLGKGELWAKYGGGVDYDQFFHRDFANHTLLVPRADHRYKEVTTFIYLSDFTIENGATAILPRQHTDHVSFGEIRPPTGSMREREVRAVGPAGSLMMYSYDVFHRGTAITDPTASRFAVLSDLRRADAPWIGKQALPDRGLVPEMREFVVHASVRQRTAVGIPAPGHQYWNEQTVRDMAVRYPGMDVSPYRDGIWRS